MQKMFLPSLKYFNKEKRNFNMKVITIKQPFASLIVEGIKEYEF